MNIINMYVLQCILCASELKCFRIYGALQIQVIIIIMNTTTTTTNSSLTRSIDMFVFIFLKWCVGK